MLQTPHPFCLALGVEGRGGQHLRLRGHGAGGRQGGQGQRAAEGGRSRRTYIAYLLFLYTYLIYIGRRPAAGDDDHAADRAPPQRRHAARGVRRAR